MYILYRVKEGYRLPIIVEKDKHDRIMGMKKSLQKKLKSIVSDNNLIEEHRKMYTKMIETNLLDESVLNKEIDNIKHGIFKMNLSKIWVYETFYTLNYLDDLNDIFSFNEITYNEASIIKRLWISHEPSSTTRHFLDGYEKQLKMYLSMELNTLLKNIIFGIISDIVYYNGRPIMDEYDTLYNSGLKVIYRRASDHNYRVTEENHLLMKDIYDEDTMNKLDYLDSILIMKNNTWRDDFNELIDELKTI